jgi:hypothetical protein
MPSIREAARQRAAAPPPQALQHPHRPAADDAGRQPHAWGPGVPAAAGTGGEPDAPAAQPRRRPPVRASTAVDLGQGRPAPGVAADLDLDLGRGQERAPARCLGPMAALYGPEGASPSRKAALARRASMVMRVPEGEGELAALFPGGYGGGGSPQARVGNSGGGEGSPRLSGLAGRPRLELPAGVRLALGEGGGVVRVEDAGPAEHHHQQAGHPPPSSGDNVLTSPPPPLPRSSGGARSSGGRLGRGPSHLSLAALVMSAAVGVGQEHTRSFTTQRSRNNQ